ncbi:MAG TPA: DUF2127 domain-containing protein [Spirochaetia bacterium]|jgi:uncharacterized membrane protein|nr:DUF2127 domain-containing protein [Spirochaetia bacterium]
MRPHPTLYRVSHDVFLVGLTLKGLSALSELVGGILLVVIPLETLRGWAMDLVGKVGSVLPLEWVGRSIQALERISPATVTFVAWYFLSHAVLKALVVACLLARKAWAYPLGIVVFVGFLGYQTWEYFRAGGVFYLLLDVLDLALIGLTAVEWRHALRVRAEEGSVSPN